VTSEARGSRRCPLSRPVGQHRRAAATRTAARRTKLRDLAPPFGPRCTGMPGRLFVDDQHQPVTMEHGVPGISSAGQIVNVHSPGQVFRLQGETANTALP